MCQLPEEGGVDAGQAKPTAVLCNRHARSLIWWFSQYSHSTFPCRIVSCQRIKYSLLFSMSWGLRLTWIHLWASSHPAPEAQFGGCDSSSCWKRTWLGLFGSLYLIEIEWLCGPSSTSEGKSWVWWYKSLASARWMCPCYRHLLKRSPNNGPVGKADLSHSVSLGASSYLSKLLVMSSLRSVILKGTEGKVSHCTSTFLNSPTRTDLLCAFNIKPLI